MSTLSAHVGYQPAELFKREVFHAVAGQPTRIGFVTRKAGEPLCGAPVPRADCPPGLFEPEVSCRACRSICAREGITVEGGQ